MKYLFLFFFPALLIASGCNRQPKTLAQPPAFSMSDTMLARCSFALAQELEVKADLRLFGKVVADNNRQAQVYPVMGGVVMVISAELGDMVQQGQILASVRSTDVADYQKQYLDAKSDLALAQKNMQVAQDLFAGKISSEKDVISARRELEQAQGAMVRIQEVYNIYKLGKGSVYNIAAPISGFIVSKNINRNEQLRTDDPNIVFSIAQIDEVWVLANVNESDIAKVQTGQDAEVQTVSYPDKKYYGKVDKIFNAIDPQTRAMKVRIRIPNTDLALKPDMSATVNLHFSEERKMTAVPSSAVIFDNSRNYVIVYKNRRKIESRPVEIYRQLRKISYVENGLAPGEKIIDRGALMIHDALND